MEHGLSVNGNPNLARPGGCRAQSVCAVALERRPGGQIPAYGLGLGPW